MAKYTRLNRHEVGWPPTTIALAHVARRRLFDALQSLKATDVKCADAKRYERLFAQAEAILDSTQPHQLLATAQEYLIRTDEREDPAQAADTVARTYAHQLLIAFFHHWKTNRL